VVHGIHAVLWALDGWLEEHRAPVNLRSIKAHFLRPMPLEEQVQYNVASGRPRDVEIEFKSFQNLGCLRSTGGMSRHVLTDAQWAVIQPWLPKQNPGPGRRRHDDRRTLNGILCVLKTGYPWGDVPRVYGSLATCWRRFSAWARDGTWERRWRALLSQLDEQGKLEWAQAFLDGSFVPAKKGALALAKRKWGKDLQ
jgi:transposase